MVRKERKKIFNKLAFEERAPVGLNLSVRKEGYRLYDVLPHVRPEASFTGLLMWYKVSRFTQEGGGPKFTFGLARPITMPVPWINSVEKNLAQMLADHSKYAGGRDPIKLRRRVAQAMRNGMRYYVMNFSTNGPAHFQDPFGVQCIADEDKGIPDFTPVRINTHVAQDIKPNEGAVGICLTVSGITIIPTPPYLADIQRQFETGADPQFPPGATEEPDGDDVPMDCRLEDLYDVTAVMANPALLDAPATDEEDFSS